MSSKVRLKLKDGRTVDAQSYGYGWVTATGEFIHRTSISSKKLIKEKNNEL